MKRVALALALVSGASATAQPAAVADAAAVTAQIAAMERAMTPGQGFAWKPLLEDGARTVAIEIWKRPGRPAVHPDQAEYAIVLDGAGTLVSGGTLVGASTTRADLVEGDRIEGGVTRKLAPGDVLLIPAGAPHWFGVEGKRLVLLGTKLAR